MEIEKCEEDQSHGQPIPGHPKRWGANPSAKLNKISTKFRFFRPLPDGSTVRVVFSFPAGTMGPATLHCPAVGPAFCGIYDGIPRLWRGPGAG